MRLATIILLSAMMVPIAYGQYGFEPYHRQSDLLPSSPGSLRYGLNGFTNPAILTYVRSFDFNYTWTSQDALQDSEYSRWGAFAGFNQFGFGAMQQDLAGEEVTDYRIGWADGNKTFSTGFSYGWSTGNTDFFQRASVWNFGLLYRPLRYLSLGAVGTQVVGSDSKQLVVDFAVRPFGDEKITAFGDFAMTREQRFADATWSAGLVAEPIGGLRLIGRYFDTEAITVGVQLGLGGVGYSQHGLIDPDGDYQYSTYSIRIGDIDRNVLRFLEPQNKYLKMNMFGGLAYQRYKLFDDRSTLYEVLDNIDAAKEDDAIAGIAMNLSGMRANREMMWEIRERLADFKKSGKRVVIFIDRVGIDGYHLASVADHIVLDPTGMIALEGYIKGRTFFSGTLEKIGIGFDEWRFFKYKSAVESYSRESMSDADKEQRKALLDANWRLASSDINEGRGIDQAKLSSLMNERMILMASQALEEQLVDTLARWDDADDVLEALEMRSVSTKSRNMLERYVAPYDNRWGEEPKIAIVYALGACAMDDGIKARSLVKTVQAVARNSKIEAVVFRVDSPGGDGMASDIVAEALKECAEKKPVVVSQGYVAASGGYWLSMYADTIVAAPHTITGSIGVIGGWVYNKEFKEKLGLTTDHVKIGEHADLLFGAQLPLIGLTLPDRNLNDAEKARMKTAILGMYDEFVGKVAEGRSMQKADVEKIAQGRVWSGYDAKENGLVDELGGLYEAIHIARAMAGIEEDEDVQVIQLPEPGLLNFSMFTPSLIGADIEDDPFYQFMKLRMEQNGYPLPMLPYDMMEPEMLDTGL